MRKLLLVAVGLLPALLNAQGVQLDLFGGFSNYQGELQSKAFTTDQSRGAFGIGLRYFLTEKLSVRAGFTYGKIAAADKYNKKPALIDRNLSFESVITEGSLLLDYNLLDLDNSRFTPYVFGGLAVFHFNPYAFDTLGNKVYLKPLSTEGEGLAQYPGRKPYHLTQLAIPFGAGIRWRANSNITLSYEFGLRKTFTDYLDDVSSTYVDQATLFAARGGKAVEMAYRGNQLKNGALYPPDGTIRGNAKTTDWYYFSGLTVSIGINPSKSNRAFLGGGKGNTACPKKVL